MFSEVFHLGKPVHSLQAMLRTISVSYPVLPMLVPDGVFGAETLEAILIFQREFAPPVTGVVDHRTWDEIVSVFQLVSEKLHPPRPTAGFPGRDYLILPGVQTVHLYLIQSMFKALSTVLEEVEDGAVTGVHSGSSVRNVLWLQRKGALEETGIVHKGEWDLLARLYDSFLVRSPKPHGTPESPPLPLE